MTQMIQPIGSARGAVTEWNRLDPRAVDKPLNPGFHGNVEENPSSIHQQRDFPGGNRADNNNATVLPAPVNQHADLRTQPLIPTVQLQSDVGIPATERCGYPAGVYLSPLNLVPNPRVTRVLQDGRGQIKVVMYTNRTGMGTE
jgi:hypothetical protein